ncbi:hypothetical protein BABINDRAFT_99743 [Babjeviella inositovora NRRL Y-12698]|uniref:Uncharacterized protein n=1 Tax=Babjeviella inositovora NRRL Y-12698 TaxID=984486 RepID=A0A1E3QHT3_9ASCO|nr:uncharacterized protein BABINDRAFT_99743 [Babjeviella inositovora NRRL Y-12698]ODQ77273.1 hypothetical protein BABINDRAFT_99743 [Babjeviella inositovora NRRL Y-12698]
MCNLPYTYPVREKRILWPGWHKITVNIRRLLVHHEHSNSSISLSLLARLCTHFAVPPTHKSVPHGKISPHSRAMCALFIEALIPSLFRAM